MSIRTVKATLRGYGPGSVTHCWRNRIPFDANGSLRGIAYPEGMQCMHGTGRLNDSERAEFTSACATDSIAFLVVSYATPIAWVLRDGTEYKVTQKFSVTTSKHSGRLY